MFEQIINYFGDATKMAQAMGVSRQAVTFWEKAGFPARKAVELEILTEGKFKAVEVTGCKRASMLSEHERLQIVKRK